MERKREKTSIAEFEKTAPKRDRAKYVLRLYVTGMTPKSTRAIANVQKLCEEYLAGCYELKVIDIYRQPKLAKGEQIIATPTLIKQLPLPLRRLIGDMSDNIAAPHFMSNWTVAVFGLTLGLNEAIYRIEHIDAAPTASSPLII